MSDAQEIKVGEKGKGKNESIASDPTDSSLQEGEKLSKHQMKRQKKYEDLMKKRPEMRAKERQKKKDRLQALRESGVELGPSRKKLKKNCMASSSCKIQVAIDCSFDDYMQDRQIMSLSQQIQFCYAANRRSANPLQFFVSSCNDKTLNRMEQQGNFRSWDVHFKEEHFTDIFSKDNIVYLSSESPNILENLEEKKAYIIGGLVDFNHHKGLCHKIAEEKGLQHARFPIDEYVNMKSRRVLTINHVFEILLRFTEVKNWKEAFTAVIPMRKGLENKPQSEAKPSKSDSPAVTVQSSESEVTQSDSIGATTIQTASDSGAVNDIIKES